MVTRNIEETRAALALFGPVTLLSEPVFDLEQRARLAMLDVAGVLFELVESNGDGPAAKWLERGVRLYHICFEVDNIDAELARACERGCVVASTPKPAVLFDGRRVAFVLDREMGLVELLESG